LGTWGTSREHIENKEERTKITPPTPKGKAGPIMSAC